MEIHCRGIRRTELGSYNKYHILVVRFGIYRTHVGDRDAFMQFVELAAVQHSLIRLFD
jgi:hypothetical protein